MGLSAFLIILFHFYPLPLAKDLLSSWARFIIVTAYIGVDIFFFMAAYMTYFSNTEDYRTYIKKKASKIYPIFILASLVYLLMGGFGPLKMLRTLLGLELVLRGGGSFLWFLPAIMIFYLLAPILKKLFKNLGHKKALVLGLLSWFVVILLLEKILKNHSVNIFLNRIPIILLGLGLAKCEGKLSIKHRVIIGLFLLGIGIYLTQKYGFMIKKKILITDSFYLLALAYSLGSIFILDVIFSRLRSYFFDTLGKISLEMYASQMLLGPYLLKNFSKSIASQRLIFVFIFISIVALSLLLRFVASKLERPIPNNPR